MQSTVRYDLAFGVPGEIIVDGLKRVQTGMLHSADAAYNIVGKPRLPGRWPVAVSPLVA